MQKWPITLFTKRRWIVPPFPLWTVWARIEIKWRALIFELRSTRGASWACRSLILVIWLLKLRGWYPIHIILWALKEGDNRWSAQISSNNTWGSILSKCQEASKDCLQLSDSIRPKVHLWSQGSQWASSPSTPRSNTPRPRKIPLNASNLSQEALILNRRTPLNK